MIAHSGLPASFGMVLTGWLAGAANEPCPIHLRRLPQTPGAATGTGGRHPAGQQAYARAGLAAQELEDRVLRHPVHRGQHGSPVHRADDRVQLVADPALLRRHGTLRDVHPSRNATPAATPVRLPGDPADRQASGQQDLDLASFIIGQLAAAPAHDGSPLM